jgi:hypothetical protein
MAKSYAEVDAQIQERDRMEQQRQEERRYAAVDLWDLSRPWFGQSTGELFATLEYYSRYEYMAVEVASIWQEIDARKDEEV